MKNVILFLFFFVGIILLRNNFFQKKNFTKKELMINSQTKIFVEVAETEEKRTRGLSGREKLLDIEGMLFVFETPARHTFWMKDMKFDLDIIWINNKKIVDITENVSHNNQQVIYSPKVPVNMVLEVNAGFVKKNEIKIEDHVNTN